VLRPLLCYDQDDFRARIVACQTVVCRSRRVARAARPLLLRRGTACAEEGRSSRWLPPRRGTTPQARGDHPEKPSKALKALSG